jgi:hypothetical protein
VDSSGREGVSRGPIRGPSRGANFAEGDGRAEDEGGSFGSALWRGEINDLGEEVGLGETNGGEGRGDGVGLAEAVIFGEAIGAALGAGEVLLNAQVNAEPLARDCSRLAAVTTLPALNFPSVFPSGIVATGGWPTGLGSYCSSTAGLISLPVR